MAPFRCSLILTTALATCIVSPHSFAQSGASSVSLTWYAPGRSQQGLSVQSLATEVWRRTSVEATFPPRGIQNLSELGSSPLLFWSLPAELPALDHVQARQLLSWLRAGGTLVLDWSGSAAHLEQVRAGLEAMVELLLPGGHLERVPRSSVLYRSFYRLKYAAGRTRIAEDLLGVQLEGRYAILVSFNDLMSALERTQEGEFRQEVVPGGEEQREEAIRLAVNIVVYAICQDYKDDKIHLDYLKSRRNWRLPGEETN